MEPRKPKPFEPNANMPFVTKTKAQVPPPPVAAPVGNAAQHIAPPPPVAITTTTQNVPPHDQLSDNEEQELDELKTAELEPVDNIPTAPAFDSDNNYASYLQQEVKHQSQSSNIDLSPSDDDDQELKTEVGNVALPPVIKRRTQYAGFYSANPTPLAVEIGDVPVPFEIARRTDYAENLETKLSPHAAEVKEEIPKNKILQNNLNTLLTDSSRVSIERGRDGIRFIFCKNVYAQNTVFRILNEMALILQRIFPDSQVNYLDQGKVTIGKDKRTGYAITLSEPYLAALDAGKAYLAELEVAQSKTPVKRG